MFNYEIRSSKPRYTGIFLYQAASGDVRCNHLVIYHRKSCIRFKEKKMITKIIVIYLTAWRMVWTPTISPNLVVGKKFEVNFFRF